MWRKEVITTQATHIFMIIYVYINTFNIPKNSQWQNTLLLCSCLVVASREGLVMKCHNFGNLRPGTDLKRLLKGKY